MKLEIIMEVHVRILKGCTEFHIEEETAVAIGKFDGVHIGHRKLISEI